VEWAQELSNRIGERALWRAVDADEALSTRGPHRGDERERCDSAHDQVDSSVVGEQAGNPEAAANAKLSHRGEEAASLADLLGGYDVGDDPGVRGSCRVEEELDDGVADDDLRVVAGRHQDHEPGNREESARDHDRSPASPAGVQAVRPCADDRRYGHREQAADSERDADGGVLGSLWDDLVDLGLDQNRRQRNPEEVAAEPERAESGVLQVPVVGGSALAGDGRCHGRKAKLSRFLPRAEKR